MPSVASFNLFAPILVGGADARAFMQGQLTTDLKKVGPRQGAFGACCNAQGRVQTLVSAFERPEGLVLLLQSDLAERVLARFRAATLSSKVSFALAPWVIAPVFGRPTTGALHELPGAPGACETVGGVTWLRFWGVEERYLVIGPDDALRSMASDALEPAFAWRRGDVMSGLPSIHAATQSSFVPQMINLDLVGGVSFDKGCYVGQEVVARARRGGVSRRMFAFSAAGAPPAPGTEVLAQEAVVGEVVDAVSTERTTRLLAVVELAQASAALSLRDAAKSELTRVQLPYGVPLERPAPRVSRIG